MEDEAKGKATQWLDAFNLVDDSDDEAGGSKVEDVQEEGLGDEAEEDGGEEAELAKLEVEACKAWVELTLAELDGKPIPPPPRLDEEASTPSDSALVSSADAKAKAKAQARGVLSAVAAGPAAPAKRPLSGDLQTSVAKKPKASPPAPVASAAVAQGGKGGAVASKSKETVRISPEIASKLTALKGKGIKVLASGVRALAEATPQDAIVALQVLLQKGQTVGDPTKWVIANLPGRAGGESGGTPGVAAAAGARSEEVPAAKASVAKAPVAKAPIAKAAIAKAPLAKAPVAKAPLAKAPVAKAPLGKAPVAKAPIGKAPVAKAPIAKAPIAKGAFAGGAAGAQGPARLPPKPRDNLEFAKLCVQEKLLSLNKQKVWPGDHPLDESAFVALLKIDDIRAIEILEEAEEKGRAGSLKDPSAYARRAVALEAKKAA